MPPTETSRPAAGSEIASFSGDGRPATSATLSTPYAVAVERCRQPLHCGHTQRPHPQGRCLHRKHLDRRRIVEVKQLRRRWRPGHFGAAQRPQRDCGRWCRQPLHCGPGQRPHPQGRCLHRKHLDRRRIGDVRLQRRRRRGHLGAAQRTRMGCGGQRQQPLHCGHWATTASARSMPPPETSRPSPDRRCPASAAMAARPPRRSSTGPQGLRWTVPTTSTLWMADNARIRKVDASTGNISTVAGFGVGGPYSAIGGAATSLDLRERNWGCGGRHRQLIHCDRDPSRDCFPRHQGGHPHRGQLAVRWHGGVELQWRWRPGHFGAAQLTPRGCGGQRRQHLHWRTL